MFLYAGWFHLPECLWVFLDDMVSYVFVVGKGLNSCFSI